MAGRMRAVLNMASFAILLGGVSILTLPLLISLPPVWNGFDIVSMTSRFGVRLQSVTVSGRHKTTLSDLWSVLNVVRGQPLLSVDMSVVQAQVETLPWVRSATVQRYFPDRLHIALMERMPVALWQDGEVFRLVDADGHLIDVPSSSYTDLLFVAGPGAPGAASDLLVTLSSQPRLMEHVAAATRVGLRRWDLWLGKAGDGRIRIKLPETDVERALGALDYLDQRYDLFSRSVETIDMRFSDRLILQLITRKDEQLPSSSSKHVRKAPIEIPPARSGGHHV